LRACATQWPFAKANPGKLNVGTITPGSTQHLSAELFETVAGIDVLVAGYNVASWNAIAAPLGTPPPVVERLNKAARDAVASPEVQAKLGKIGVQVQASSPTELQALLASDALHAAPGAAAARPKLAGEDRAGVHQHRAVPAALGSALPGQVQELHRNYHIPISNTAAATMVFDNRAAEQRKAA
jgi:hypothetical protein